MSSRVSAEKIIRTLSNIPEFSILVEGLDAITLGDVYKAAFPNGILHSIREKYVLSPTLDSNSIIVSPENLDNVIKSTVVPSINEGEVTDNGVENGNEYDEVNEDEPSGNLEDLKEEPITDDYVYDQPIEDRFTGDRENVTRDAEESNNEDPSDSKKQDSPKVAIVDEEKRKKELLKYGARFLDWMTKFLTG